MVPLGPPSLCLLQLCEKEEEEELAERSEHDSGINEEPLLTAEQVPSAPVCTQTPKCAHNTGLAFPRTTSAHPSPMVVCSKCKKGQIPSVWNAVPSLWAGVQDTDVSCKGEAICRRQMGCVGCRVRNGGADVGCGGWVQIGM